MIIQKITQNSGIVKVFTVLHDALVQVPHGLTMLENIAERKVHGKVQEGVHVFLVVANIARAV